MATGTGLTGKTGTNMHVEYSGAVDVATPKLILSRFTPITWTWGTGENQINTLFQDLNRTTNIGGETLDLTTGLFDCFNNPLTMTVLKFLYVKNTHATTILSLFGNTSFDLLIMSGTTNAVQIPPGGEFYWSGPLAGIDVTTNIKLFIQCTTAADVTFDIILGGLD